MFGAMMAGLLGLAGAGSTTAQAVGPDGWWTSDYVGERFDETRARRNGRVERRGDGTGARVLPVEERYDVYGAGDRFERGRRDRVRVEGRGRVDVRGDGRVGYRLPGRVVVEARPAYRRGRYVEPGFYWTEVGWDVRFKRNAFRHHRGRPNLNRVLDGRTVKRLRRHRDRLGVRGRLTFRWVDAGRYVTVLQVRAGHTPLAELVDFGHDRYVDVVRLSQFAW